MSPYDIIVAILLLWAAIAGYRDGLLKQLFSWVGFLVSLYMAYHFSPSLAATFGLHTAVAFVIICVGVPMVCSLIAALVTRVLDWTLVLGLLNRIGGLVLCILKYTAIISVVTYVGSQVVEVPETFIQDSLTYTFFHDLAPNLWQTLYPTPPTP